jgi:exodeoxyribonuclease III
MKLISWNVNSLRANKNFIRFFKEESADIICLQETKANSYQIGTEGYYQYWNHAEKKGYAGTALITKVKPINVSNGIGILEHDKEGRVIAAEYKDFILVNVYTPNSKRGLLRLDYRQIWDREFLKYLKNLEKRKPVIACGDFNVAHKEIDIARPKDNMTTATRPGNAGFTNQERAGFDNILNTGFIDTFREFDKSPGKYSWWSYMFNARAKNIGWRIDYFIISESLKPKLKNAFIMDKVMGSDHCPVGIEIDG